MYAKRLARRVLVLAVAWASGIAHAGHYDEFVSLDAETKYFRNADGVFCGFGMNYNQVLDGKLQASPYGFDLDVMADDLGQIERMGFTHVVFRIEWGNFVAGEGRDPDAAYAKWQRTLDMVKEHGLYAEIWFDSWVWPPDMTLEDKFNFIFVEGNWKRYLDWIAEVTAHFKDNKTILAWRSENESLPVREKARHDQQPALVARFQKALRDHYGDIERLNAAWQSSFASFDEVKLPTKEEEMSARLIDYNILFHEPFVIARNQELARVVRKSDPNHLLIISGIGAVGGRVGGLFEIHDVDRLTGFDICGNGLYGDFPPQGTGSLLHHARTVRKFLSLGKPAMITEVGISHSEGNPLRCLQKEWILAQFADATGAGATAMDIWDYTWITDAKGNYRSSDNAPCDAVRDFIRKARGAVFAQESARVLIVRTKAEDYGYWPWRSHGNAQMLGDFLYQMHVPYDVMTDANLTPERLEKYSFIFVPSQSVLVEEPVWRMIDEWIRLHPRRGIALGFLQPMSRTMQPTDLPPTLAALAGTQAAAAAHDVIGFQEAQVLSLLFTRSFGPLKRGETLEINPGEHALLWDMPKEWAASARIAATVKVGDDAPRPALVENRLPGGSRVYCTAFAGGLVTWSMNPTVVQPAFDNLVPLYGEMLERAGVKAVYDAPRSVGVYISTDNNTVIVKERMGRSTTQLVRSDRLGRSLFSDAQVTLANGEPTLLSAELPPRGVGVFKRLPITVGESAGPVTARAWSFNPEYVELEISGRGAVNVTVGGLKPNTDFRLHAVESPTHRLTASEAASDDSGTVTLKRTLNGTLSIRMRAEKAGK